MMKSQYLKVRKQIIESNLKGEMKADLNFFYNYFMLKSKTIIEPHIFQTIFLQGNFKEIVKHLDREFKLMILLDRDGTELKVIE